VPTNRTHTRIMPLLQALFAHDAPGVSDGHLLQRFLTQRDEGAFAVLVRRHGSMVLGVCRRILGNHADAEDACQAAFLVLVRKASSLTGRQVVGDWLHGVARRTALKAKSAAARRRLLEPAMARPIAQGEQPRNDWLPKLDAAIARLPEKYRLPIVLCDLEGKTRQQAATQLHWPEGTVAGRLARARALLAKRVLRDALIVSGAVPGAIGAAKAAMPLALAQSTIEAAAIVASGETIATGAFSESALTLAKGVIQTMFWNKMKLVALSIFAAAVLAGVGGRTVQMLAASDNDLQTQQPLAVIHALENRKPQEAAQAAQPEENRVLAKLNQDLVDAGLVQWDGRIKEYLAGKTTVDFVLVASRQLLQAEVRNASNKKDGSSVAAYEDHAKRMRQIEEISKGKYEAGQIPITGFAQVTYARVEAEIKLEEARRASVPGERKAKKVEVPSAKVDKQSQLEPGAEAVTSAKEQFDARWREFMADKTNVDFVLAASAKLMNAELKAAPTAKNKLAVLESHHRKAEELWNIAKSKYAAGQMSIA
jgi:RNA polymerase sigma factor (sigma-70 family)